MDDLRRLDRDRLARAYFATIRPDQHGQLCPVWRSRASGAGWESCDCWQLDWSRRRAEMIADEYEKEAT